MTTSRSLGPGKHKILMDLGVLGLSEQGGSGGAVGLGRFCSLGCRRRLCGGKAQPEEEPGVLPVWSPSPLGLTGRDRGEGKGEGVEEATNPLGSEAVMNQVSQASAPVRDNAAFFWGGPDRRDTSAELSEQ